MKVNETPGIFHIHEAIDPDVIRAQRMQELADLAEYRQRHLQAVKDWADPVKREAKQAEAKEELQKAYQEIEGKEVWLPAWRTFGEIVGVKELRKEPYAPLTAISFLRKLKASWMKD